MDRDFVWEADYGERKKLTLFMKELLRRQDSTSLQTLGVFINNNPYNLELFVFVSYDNPKDDDLIFMKEGFEKIGLIYQFFSQHKEVMVTLKVDGNFQGERLWKVKHHRRPLYER